jgi:hypothetical protein
MARPVAKIIALPAPWRIRKRMSCKAEEATAQSREESEGDNSETENPFSAIQIGESTKGDEAHG